MIVQELFKIQEEKGFLPAGELLALSRRLEVPLHRLHEVASFFPHFRLDPPPRVEVRVCRDMACHMRGAPRLLRGLESLASSTEGVHVDGVSCLGQCDRAPAVSMNDHVYRGLTEQEIRARIYSAAAGEPPAEQLADCAPRGWKIDPYDGQPRYEAIRRFIELRDADGIISKLKDADLMGMGGAGFRTHLKWTLVRKAPGAQKYVVCNADESEPGTFKDRELIRRTPHLLIEGMVLGGLVTGASQGFVYIRHEYHQEISVLKQAIKAAQKQGVCGERILGSNLSFSLDVFPSPGGYICGEESALLEAMEDRRAEPRNKPPFPVLQGLYNKPTVINNVETLCWVPSILLKGGSWYRGEGANGASGLRFVSISGDVNLPGVYEIPFGLTVNELIDKHAGGMSDGQQLKAIALSGPSSGYLPAMLQRSNLPPRFVEKRMAPDKSEYDIRNLPLDIPTVRDELGSMLGAACVVVGDRACMVDLALNTTQFFRNESCGKCVPCRMGSQKLAVLLEEIASGKARREVLEIVPDLAQTMNITSICGLGMVASNPISMLITHFPNELSEHIDHHRCPLGICAGLAS